LSRGYTLEKGRKDPGKKEKAEEPNPGKEKRFPN